MASTVELSANSRKLQEDEIERLVKCRVRSEIEARKAAEATMKRAVQEARELKKELMLMRQEKEELKQDSRKATLAAATTPTPGGVVTKDDLQKKLSQEKAKRMALTTQLEAANQQVAQQRDLLELQDAQLAKAQSRHDDAVRKAQEALMARQREFDALQDEAKKLKSAADDAKRKCQRAVKEKKEELQQLLDENAQLTKKCDALERLGEENARLRKLLDKAKDKQGGVADEWQRRLDQREQAFLREEQASKAQLADKQREIEALQAEKRELIDRIDELEAQAAAVEDDHAAAMERQEERSQELMASTKQIQDRLQTLKDAGRVADRARLDAEARLARAQEQRETAEAAADAVEARAEKAELQLRDARQQLEQVEKALKKKGISIDFLLKTGSSSSTNKTSKEPKGPEDDGDGDEPVTRSTIAVKKKAVSVAPPPPAMTKDASRPVLESNTRTATTVLTRVKPTPAGASGTVSSSRSNNNHSHADREPTPERVRK